MYQQDTHTARAAPRVEHVRRVRRPRDNSFYVSFREAQGLKLQLELCVCERL